MGCSVPFIDPGDYELPIGYSGLEFTEFGGRFMVFATTSVECPNPMWFAGNPRRFMGRGDALQNHRFLYFDSLDEALAALESVRKSDPEGWNDHE